MVETDPQELFRIIENGAKNQPRNLQRAIGPSGVGDPCFVCLACRLAEVEPSSGEWKPAMGTAVHTWLEGVFDRDNQQRVAAGRQPRWLLESKVSVGHIGDQEITGSADVYDLQTNTVIDWKVVGPTTLRSAKKAPSVTYQRQLHLYGRGFLRAGHPVRHVAVCFLPRNCGEPRDKAVWWTEPFNENVAVDALVRAEHVKSVVDTMGIDAILDQIPPTKGCFGCARRGPRNLLQLLRRGNRL